MLFLRTLAQYILTGGIAIVTALTFIFVFPWVVLREHLTKPKSAANKKGAKQIAGAGKQIAGAGKQIAALFFVGATMGLLAGCEDAGQVFDKAGLAVDRATEFAATAPKAPYDAVRSAQDFEEALPADLILTAEQIALTEGAAKKTDLAPALVAYTIEKELRALDAGELERDVVSALAGENTSIGIAQVKLSTADEIERLDDADLFPDQDKSQDQEKSDQARTERIRRLAADDWSILYSAAYLAILESRHPGEPALDIAQRYTGRTPGATSDSDQTLFQTLTELFK